MDSLIKMAPTKKVNLGMSYDIYDLRGKISHLPKGLLEHIDRVVDISLELAQRFDIDPEKARVSALLHDVARVTRGPELLKLAKEFGLPVTLLEERLPIFIHGPVGAEMVRRDMGVRDGEILEAIRYHTIGRGGMGPVARVLYLADKLDPAKDARYPFNPEVRGLARNDLATAILAFIDGDIASNLARGRLVHPSTIEFRNQLLTEMKASCP
ncbi:MAG: bis(5'-nucleosyl)-tetraphosphatase (symmetrical) YqeK [Chloroflexi bacterium]|nr:bis(5'-nucleosyl)-tetraphosphatase (symmetrical) YqeK [Chloroflexota bacterium]